MPKTKQQEDNSSVRNLPAAAQGEWGRYHDALQQGYTVRIHEEDGTTTVQHFQLEEGTVLLDPDVREYFPDAKSVNAALRSLIALIPAQRKGRAARRAPDSPQQPHSSTGD